MNAGLREFNNSNGKSRTFGVLMPLGYLLDIIQNAGIEYFLESEGVRCHWRHVDAKRMRGGVYNLRK